MSLNFRTVLRWLGWPVTVIAALLATAASATAAPRDYAIDPVHTRLVFSVDHAGLSRAHGTFSGVQGWMRLDPDNLAAASVDVRIPIDTLEIGDAGWRKTMLGGTWLAAERHPDARFTSTQVQVLADGTLQISGPLTLRGVTREVVLSARLNAVKRHPLTLRRTAGFSATTQLRRSDFGMTAWSRLVGDTIDMVIDVEATRSRKSATAASEDRHADTQQR